MVLFSVDQKTHLTLDRQTVGFRGRAEADSTDPTAGLNWTLTSPIRGTSKITYTSGLTAIAKNQEGPYRRGLVNNVTGAHLMRDVERFVEARFLVVDLEEAPKIVKLVFREPNGTRFFLSAFDMHRLLVSELRETNIVDHLDHWDSSADTDSYINALYEFVSGKDGRQDENWRHVVETEAKAIRDGLRVFVSIEAVYGAQVLMLARNFVVSE